MRDQHRSQLRELQDYLSVSGIPEDDLTTLEDALLEGSCQWLTWKKQYQAWRDFHPGSLPYYWLSGQPATGKSVLAAHVLRNLEDINANCCYYFFKHNDTEKSSLSGCLRSLAYQMAVIDLRVRSHLMAMKHDEVRLDKENDLSVWRKVYLYGIFELVLDRPFFWVIDALDECSSQSNIISLLGKAYGIFPLRVFVSSRATPEISRNFSQLEELIYADELTPNDTRGDIELYLRANMRSLMLKNEPFCQKVTETILNRSCGSFLWVVLVLEELRSAFSEGEVQQVLEEVPPGMDALYKRALLLMSKTSRGKHLVKAVLLWIVCAIRPLTLKELEHAILLDTGESVLSLDKFILSTCGQLVHVDKNGRVSLIHETVRAFLLKDDLQSEFAVEKFEAHGQIAEVCLRYLNNDEMKPPRSQKLMQIHRAKAAKRSPITQYACMYFSQHLRRSHSENSQLLISLVKFLEGNVCSWIELMASTGNLHQLIRTAKDLKGFLQARAKYHSPISKEVQRVSSWEADLVRLVAQFGGGLLAVPSAIFWLIPPFCPPTSAIGSQFASLPHGITVEGLASSAWSDRSCCIHYHGKQTRAIACTDTAFVVGLSDKSIRHYSYSTYQQLQQLSVMQPTKLLALSNSGKLMAASSVHYVMMFELETGQRLWQTRSPQECLTLSFANQDKSLQILTKGGILSFISATDGSRLSYISLEETSNKTDHAGFRRIFTCATFSFELSMIAAVQRGGSIGLYDMEEGSFVGLCKRDAETELESTDFALSWVSDFIFNPNPAISLLAALYHDGNLVLFDPCQLAVVAQVETDAQVLTCSHDGRILATGDAVGTIQVLEFESLNLIYKVIASDDPIRSLVFSRDNLRFIDIRGSQCNLW